MTNPRHPSLLLTSALLLLTGAVGCTGSGQAPGDGASASPPPPITSAPPSTPPSDPPSSGPSGSTPTPRSGGPITLQRAIALALEAEKGDAVGAELDRFGEGAAWRVDVRRSRSVTVEVALDTTSGTVLAQTGDDTDEEAATVPDSTATKAADAAEARVEGGQATQVELDNDDEGGREARRVWQVSVRRAGAQPVEVTFDADSGRFIRQQND